MKRPVSREYPKTHLMNPERVYVPSWQTNISETIERAKKAALAEQRKSRRQK